MTVKSNCQSNQAELPMNGAAAPRNPTDRVFRTGSGTVSGDPEVRLLVERLVAEACLVLKLRTADETSGEDSSPAVDPLGRSQQDVNDAIIDEVRMAFDMGHASSLARSIEAMSLSDEDARLAGLIRTAFEVACATPRLKVDVRRELLASRGAKAHGLYLDDALLRNFSPCVDGPAFASPVSQGHVFALAVQVEMLSDDDEDQVCLKDLQIRHEGFGDLAKLVASSLAAELGAPILGGYILPRFLTHEGIGDLGMQMLYDLPASVLKRCRLSAETLPNGSELVLPGSHVDGDQMVDVPMLGSRRVLYLVGVTWGDDPWLASVATDAWRREVEPSERERMALAITAACQTSSHRFETVDVDLFFYGIRSGIQFQRGQVFIDNLESILERNQVAPSDCFFEVVQAKPLGLPPCPALRVHDTWMDEIGEIPWPLLTFEDMQEQTQELHKLAVALEMRAKSDVTFFNEEGSA